MALNNFPYPKGSIWRRWDLQTQTILDDGYISLANYSEYLKTQNPTAWNQYIVKIGGEDNALLYDSKSYFNDTNTPKKNRCVNYVRNYLAFIDAFCTDLECIGITDHNYFDDCLLDEFIEYTKKTRCKIIPGIEINCQGIHLLIYFPDKLYNKPTFSSGIHAFLTRFNINNRNNPDGSLTTTSADIKDIIDEVKKNNGILIYPHCNSNNGLFQERTSTDRTHLADIFNHQKFNLLQFQNQQSLLTVNDYIKSNHLLTSNFCSHISSDARSLKDFGRCDHDGNYLWVKADPSFEGLKQIIYEPDYRIFLGPHKPDAKKTYFLIDKVRFLDNTTDIKFPSDYIEINQNLTTIIGGKSTGKSLLLYYIAKTIDPQEVKDRTALKDILSINYNFDDSSNFNFEVLWEDGQRTLLKSLETESKSRKILYLPQKYLNTLSESNIKSREALNDFVLSVILQDLDINNRYQETLRDIKNTAKSIPAELNELFSIRDDIKNAEGELKKVGDEKGIRNYIETLQNQANLIKEKSGLSDDQLQKYESLTAKEKEISTKISNLEDDRKTIGNFNILIKNQFNVVSSAIDEHKDYLIDLSLKDKFKAEFTIVESFSSNLKAATSNIYNFIDDKISILKKELLTINDDLSPLLAKIKLQSELQNKTNEIKLEQKKLDDIAIKKKNLKNKNDNYERKISTVKESYKSIYKKYESLRNEFKIYESKFGDIALGVHVNYNNDLFNLEVVKEFINKTDLKRIIAEAEWGEEFIYKYDSTKHIANISKVFDGIISGKINTIKNRQAKDAVIKLLDNYFYLDFQIFYKNDSLDKMSPGKKGLVLLQLLIDLSNEEWPILLDQPEDDLDNRSVYEDLVNFIKKKKLHRQIIVVTHNPNLVVGADAEETIVANQSGQEIGRENKKYRFEYVSGALENTFEYEATREPAILYRKGIRQHVCEILEGGQEAFQKREQKYDFPK
jgi:predicted ATPase